MNWWQRLKAMRTNEAGILSINRRNLHYVYPHNARRDFPLADNKLKLKEFLANSDIPLPKTLASFSYFYELRNLQSLLAEHEDFVIKPASGRGGGGIIVIKEKSDHGWLNMGGKLYTLTDIRTHISDIIFGVHSFSLADQAIVEQRILQHPNVSQLSPSGLADVRVILLEDQPALCMIRIATKDSNGTANLHQGALGVGIDWESGKTTHASQHGQSITKHPDTGTALIGVSLPHWQQIRDIALKVARTVPLKYLGIDIAIGETSPFLLEINARPGIEIQNVNQIGLRHILENITKTGRQA